MNLASSELGFKNQQAETMTGVFVPAGTPRPIVDLLQKGISTIVRMPDVADFWSSALYRKAIARLILPLTSRMR